MLRGRLRTDAIPDPPAPGWPALYRTVREADVNKVEDCREDIDTLLVFAGLYSAVLTAFVIESYTHLQQDPQDVIIGLLQQIATQHYISGPGFINSTTTSTSPPPFEPPLWAIRVNVLWFASLLLSLASASFGILVKQWLREYLAIEYTVPQQRLRARQYRYPALAQWKVFEIAAFLPLLLQLSLGLFFAGLCFFTAAVHRSVGRTTTPLVCAWAFLLFATTIAPLFSPRCPFKTTFLKRTLKGARRYFILIVTLLGRLLVFLLVIPLFYPVILPIILGYAAVCDRFTKVRHIRRSISRGLTHLSAAVSAIFRTIGACELSDIEDWIAEIPRPWMQYPAFGVRIIVGIPCEFAADAMKALTNQGSNGAAAAEEDFVRKEGDDAEILLSVDALMPDDGLLKPMLDAFRQQSGITPAKIVAFVLRIIGHRIGQDLGEERLTCTPDLAALSKHAWTVLTDGIVDAFQPGSLALYDKVNSDFLYNAITILHSSSYHQLSEYATSALREVAVVPVRGSGHTCSGSVRPYRYLSHDAGTPPPDALPSPDIEDKTLCLLCVMDIYITLLRRHFFDNPPSLHHLLDERISDNNSEQFLVSLKGLLQGLFSALMSFLLRTISLQKDLAKIPGSHEAVHVVLQYGEKFGRRDDAVKLCCQMLLTESGTRMLLDQSAALHPQCRVRVDVRGILWGALRQASLEENNQIRSHLNSACERFCNGGDDGDDDVPLDYVRLCAAFIWWVYRDDQTAQAMANAIEKYYQTRGWRKERRHREYWYSDSQSPTPEELFKEDQDLACKVFGKEWIDATELIDALWLFVPKERREEVLRSIRSHSWSSDYTPRVRPAPETGPEDSEDGRGESSASGAQEVGGAALADISRVAEEQVDGGTERSAEEGKVRDERTEDQDATERETVAQRGAEAEGYLSGEGSMQGMTAMAEVLV